MSRSLAACEGAILVVDASQGVQAQTLSNLFLALDAGLTIIPILNKIDLPGAEPERRRQEVIELLGVAADEILLVSAKEGIGIHELLERIVSPGASPDGRPRRAAARAHLRLLLRPLPRRHPVGARRRWRDPAWHADHLRHERRSRYEVAEVGYNQLRQVPAPSPGARRGRLRRRERASRDGDTRRRHDLRRDPPRGGRRCPAIATCGRWCSPGCIRPTPPQYENLRDALEKLQLNDASLQYEPETSTALGFGFRAGFLGLLHMEIVQERLEREFDLDLVTTVPSVEYKVYRHDGTVLLLENPSRMPHGRRGRPRRGAVRQGAHRRARRTTSAPIMTLVNERRGVYKNMSYVDTQRVEFDFEFPLAEIILDFYDRLKTISRGYASLDYEMLEYRASDLVKLDMLINGDPVDAFSVIIHRDKAYDWGRKIADKLKELIPRQLFEVVIQAAIGTKVIARTTVRPLRKNVLAKCYGGDITRKRKLLEKQKEGKQADEAGRHGRDPAGSVSRRARRWIDWSSTHPAVIREAHAPIRS